MEMSPWNRACAGSEALCGIYSRATLEKPPVSASDIFLQAGTVPGSEKSSRTYGAVGVWRPSAFRALTLDVSYDHHRRERAFNQFSSLERRDEPMLDSLLNSSRLRFAKPGASRRDEGCIAAQVPRVLFPHGKYCIFNNSI